MTKIEPPFRPIADSKKDRKKVVQICGTCHNSRLSIGRRQESALLPAVFTRCGLVKAS